LTKINDRAKKHGIVNSCLRMEREFRNPALKFLLEKEEPS
jgi:hypothetical protein